MKNRRNIIPALFFPGVIPAILVALCMRSRRAGDFYSLHIYPAVSSVLSFIASPFGFSLQAFMIVVFAAAFIAIIVKSCKTRKSFFNCLLKEITLIACIFVWSYAGWCLNYARSPITSRTGVARAGYDSTAFRSFLSCFTDGINGSWVPDPAPDMDEMEGAVKCFYSSVPDAYGLCSPKKWQHSKKMPLHRLESAMGISGYIGPFFCESHVNPDVPAADFPFTFAHEYSHLLGVSNEAEANWWAFQCCRNSGIPQMRYSGYLCMLPYVVGNASRLLPEDDFKEWISMIRKEVKDDYNDDREFWKSKRIPALDRFQTWIYDIFLKGNNIPSGVSNYSEVIALLISLEDIGNVPS